MSTLLDVAIGVSLLYLSLALIFTATQELLASWLAGRARHLYQVLGDLATGTVASDDGRSKLLVEALYEHALMRHLADRAPAFVHGSPGLFARGMPSYIPSRTFAIALLDVLRGTRGAADAIGAGSLLASARSTIPRPRHRVPLLASLPPTKGTRRRRIGSGAQRAATVGVDGGWQLEPTPSRELTVGRFYANACHSLRIRGS